MPQYLKTTLFIIGLIFSFNHASISTDSKNISECSERNWRKNFNIEIKDHENIEELKKIGEWFLNNKPLMNDNYKNTYIQPIMSEDIKTCNFAKASFYILYTVNDNKKIHAYSFPISKGKFSLSGQRKFKQEEDGKILIVTGHSFDFNQQTVTKSNNENGKRCDDIKQRVNKILEKNIVPEGGHSEAYLLLELYNELQEQLGNISSIHEQDTVKIIGTILPLSSFKDPCDKNCFPMFISLNDVLPKILTEKIQNKNISVVSNLERLILMGGTEPHMSGPGDNMKSTREKYDLEASRSTFSENIIIDFKNPKARVFSAQFKDMSN